MAIRVTCPKCKAGYSLGEDKLGKKIRCAKCQEIFVAQVAKKAEVTPSRKKSEPPKDEEVELDEEADLDEAEVDDDVSDDEGEAEKERATGKSSKARAEKIGTGKKKKFKLAKKQKSNAALYVKLGVGALLLLLFLPLGWYVFRVVTADPEAVLKDIIQVHRDMKDVIATVQDPSSAQAAASKLDPLLKRYQEIGERFRGLKGTGLSREIFQKYEGDLNSAGSALQDAVREAEVKAGGDASFQAAMKRMREIDKLLE